MSNRKQHTKTLVALTSSALLIPSLSLGMPVPDKKTLSVRYSNYAEDSIAVSDTTLGGSSDIDRYDINVLQVGAAFPVSEKLAMAVNLDIESMSGATPWYIVRDSNNAAKVVMTGASVDDQRTEMMVTTGYYFPDGKFDFNVGFSKEDDYYATVAGLGFLGELNNKQTSLEASVTVSADKLEPTPTERIPSGTVRETDRRKGSFSIYLGVTQVINRFTTLQTGVDFGQRTGYLGDPYKLVAVMNGVNASPRNEVRPENRSMLSWTTRLRKFMPTLKGTLHLDYRFYDDTWGIQSHTIDTAWHHPITSTIDLIPSFRFYQQSEASFYEPYFIQGSIGEFYSSDYRLSAFSSVSFGIGVQKTFKDLKLLASIEQYQSSDDNDIENAALVDFMILSLGVDYKF